MRSWIEFLAAAGVCSAVALASSASFGQGADVGGARPYDPYVAGYYGGDWPQWQYRGGPKSTSTTDYYWGPNAYWYEGGAPGETFIPR